MKIFFDEWAEEENKTKWEWGELLKINQKKMKNSNGIKWQMTQHFQTQQFYIVLPSPSIPLPRPRYKNSVSFVLPRFLSYAHTQPAIWFQRLFSGQNTMAQYLLRARRYLVASFFNMSLEGGIGNIYIRSKIPLQRLKLEPRPCQGTPIDYGES